MLILFDLAAVAFLISLLLTPFVRDYAIKRHWVDQPDQSRKLHARPIPRLGGIGIAIAYLAALGLSLIAPYKNLPFDLPKALDAGFRLLPAAVTIFAVGLIDDIYILRAWQKLVGQVLASIMAYAAGFGVVSFQGDPLPMWISLPVTVFWLVGCANALNLIDGMDGLAAGVGFFASMTTMIAALTHQNMELALVTAPLAGALLGFLRYNFNPASIFLGDCGSLLIGFLLGCFGAVWSHKSATVLGMTAPLMALAIPLLEVVVSIVRRFLRKQPIFQADREHIHHRLLAQGFTQRRAVLILYGMCGLAALFSLLQDVGPNQFSGLVVVLFCVAAWIGVQHLGYGEFSLARKIVLRGSLRNMIDVQLRLQHYESTLAAAASPEQVWEAIRAGCEEFGFEGARLLIRGAVFENPISPDRPTWQIRIPLPHKQYVNFYRNLDASMHPVVLTLFSQATEKMLREKFTGIAGEESGPTSLKAP
ncbi:MAG: undecaprenyl/decaprenyl-phosphate alpha-N-acetylglucosaminyl 1-phosphate transferase [Sphingomonadaceae bacterium]|nr:undecaprenyl/decaprenyl-phosphate alpha-N-acetylglucosaminyl 1-phosphate transferase [Sphingomonadaceae bacterium]